MEGFANFRIWAWGWWAWGWWAWSLWAWDLWAWHLSVPSWRVSPTPVSGARDSSVPSRRVPEPFGFKIYRSIGWINGSGGRNRWTRPGKASAHAATFWRSCCSSPNIQGRQKRPDRIFGLALYRCTVHTWTSPLHSIPFHSIPRGFPSINFKSKSISHPTSPFANLLPIMLVLVHTYLVNRYLHICNLSGY